MLMLAVCRKNTCCSSCFDEKEDERGRKRTREDERGREKMKEDERGREKMKTDERR
jgi:hypothetical protein